MSLHLTLVSSKQRVIFVLSSNNFYLLTGLHSPYTSNVTTDMFGGFKSTVLPFLFYLSHSLFHFLSLSFLLRELFGINQVFYHYSTSLYDSWLLVIEFVILLLMRTLNMTTHIPDFVKCKLLLRFSRQFKNLRSF